MIPEKQIEDFITAMNVKGYTSNYAAPGTSIADLSSVLHQYLNNRLTDNQLGRAFPFWISTLVEGEYADNIHTLGHLKINYDEKSGLTVNEMKLMIWNRTKDNMEVKYHKNIETITELPTRQQAQKLCPQKSERIRKRNNRKL